MSAVSESSKNTGLASRQEQAVSTLTTPLAQIGFLVTLVLTGLAVIAFVIYLLAALDWRSRPFFGAMLNPNMVVDGSQSINPQPWPGLAAGLKRLDHVVAINGQPLSTSPGDYATARQTFVNLLKGLQVGAQVTVEVTRPTGTIDPNCTSLSQSEVSCQFRYTFNHLPDNDFLTFFVIPYSMGLVTLLAGFVVLILRPRQPAARLTTLFCVTFAIFMGGTFDLNNTYMLVPLWLLASSLIGGILVSLALIFPMRELILYQRPSLYYAGFAASALIAALVLVFYLFPPTPQSFSLLIQVTIIAAILGAAVMMIKLLRQRRYATTDLVRDQSNTVLIGTILTLLPVALWLLNTLVQSLTGNTVIALNTSAIMPFFIMPPLSLAYAVLQHQRGDSDRFVSQTITYLLMLVALVAAYFLLVLGSSLITREALRERANDPVLIAATIFLMALLFLPVRNYLQQQIDRIYFRKRINYQERQEAFGRQLTTLGELKQLIPAYQRELEEAVSPGSIFVFLPDRQTGDYVAFGTPKPPTDIRFEVNSGLVTMLKNSAGDLIDLRPGQPWSPELHAERARLSILKTLLIARLRGRTDLIGFVCIAPPRSGKGLYPFEAVRFIENITGQLTVAVERALATEAQERRVRELDVFSQISQAVNFTVEFDDLLELINAQTERLIEAPHFYIVLRDPGNDKLYFAFFLENYERYRENENQRWGIGRDLFSEVVRTGAPLRVDDYAKVMNQRHTPIVYEDPNLKAWIGVPLAAGSTTLGVLAAGTPQPGKTYSQEQLRILSDIASLAATSLDKARLFEETNRRARQLRALNDISQQLASELHVDSLLELITESAVNILDAEAGSLLLLNDDRSLLEFKVAVGGSGQELVGSRFPANKGLAGEVASSGKPVIVNDTSQDPRWGGEVGKGGFSTNAVLAVPLIAQNKAIGVLEVINRKNGGIYIKEDADLLTTFAGQAAIAIENARLFEMTDLQLSQRVDELQTMERIDVELNRSLDLHKVAEITVRWAVANTGASAGALGLITGDPPRLQIIGEYGYTADDYPEGAEGKSWPLDQGIVRRVMRTRRADLATDVSIDPDYKPSLRGALSQLTVPMLSGGAINAILLLETDKEPRLNLLDMAFVQRLAEHASIAITNAQLYAELTRANESKSEFVGFVAHELKNPMTSMRGFADLLISGAVGKLSEQQQNFVSIIRSNVDRMITLVSDLNDVTKLQTNNMRMEIASVDFHNVLTETLRPLRQQIEDKGQQLVIQMADNLPLILADQNRLIQVLTNLLSNAYKYTPPNGTITLSARLSPHNHDAKGKDLGPMLHVSVKDTGIGLSPEDQAKLFTPYFRSDNPLAREQPGTGLGLTITRGIVIRHGGNIWLESELGKGTTFHFTIPLAPETKTAEPEAEKQAVK